MSPSILEGFPSSNCSGLIDSLIPLKKEFSSMTIEEIRAEHFGPDRDFHHRLVQMFSEDAQSLVKRCGEISFVNFMISADHLAFG